jgi:hypothetical protein
VLCKSFSALRVDDLIRKIVQMGKREEKLKTLHNLERKMNFYGFSGARFRYRSENSLKEN